MEPPWLQPVATVGNRPCADSPGTSEKRCRALRPVAVWIAMVKSAFATACHRLRGGPLFVKEGVNFLAPQTPSPSNPSGRGETLDRG